MYVFFMDVTQSTIQGVEVCLLKLKLKRAGESRLKILHSLLLLIEHGFRARFSDQLSIFT